MRMTQVRSILYQVRRVLRSAGLLCAAAAAWGCAQVDDTPVVVGTNIWLGYEPAYLAESRGLYGTHDVDLRQFSSATEVLRAFRNEAVDIAALTLDEAMSLARSGVPIKIILVADISRGADAIIARPPITSVKELAGRRVGVENSALGAYMLSRALVLNDVRSDQVIQVSLTADETVQHFRKGDVDAVVSFEPYKSQLLRDGGRKVFDSREIPDEIIDVVVVRESFAVAHPEALRAVVTGWLAGADLVRRQSPTALAEISARMKMTMPELQRALTEMKLPTSAENTILLSGPKSPVAKTGEKLLPFLDHRAGQVIAIHPERLTTTDFLPEQPK